MIHWLSSLIGGVAAFVLILAGLIYIVSPKHGRELLRRFMFFLGGAFIGLCLLRQFAICLDPRSGMVLGLAMVIVAYFIREAWHTRNPRPGRRHWGPERMPAIPTHIDHEEDL